MDPAIWGPATWDCLFACARALDREGFGVVLDGMRYLIPCRHCRDSYREWYVSYPPTNASPVTWLWMIKDLVNQKLGKRALALSVVERRLNLYSLAVSPYGVFDTLTLLALGLEDPVPEHGSDLDAKLAHRAFVAIVPRFRAILRPVSLAAFLVDVPTDTAPRDLWRHVLRCQNDMRRASGEARESEAEARVRYAHATPPPLLRPERPPHRPRGVPRGKGARP
jgi:hypothetical protein